MADGTEELTVDGCTPALVDAGSDSSRWTAGLTGAANCASKLKMHTGAAVDSPSILNSTGELAGGATCTQSRRWQLIHVGVLIKFK